MPGSVSNGDSFTSVLPSPPATHQTLSPLTAMSPPKPTDFGSFVVQVLAQSTRDSQGLNQHLIRQCLGLSSSFLVTDSTTNPETGVHTWTTGFNRLIDILVALHARNELELESVNAASRACSECWMISGSWRGLVDCREGVRAVAERLKKLLDHNGRTYRGDSGLPSLYAVSSPTSGQAVYTP